MMTRSVTAIRDGAAAEGRISQAKERVAKLEAEAAGLRQSVEELRRAKDTAQKEWDMRVSVGEGWQEATVIVLDRLLLLTDSFAAARRDGRGVGGRGEGRGRELGSQGGLLGGLASYAFHRHRHPSATANLTGLRC